MNQLEEYIYNQLTKGYTPDQIRSFLVARGYEQKQVESAIVFAKDKFLEHQLVQYVSSTLQQGYQPQQIHDQLLKQGYKEKTVDEAFSELNKNQYGGKLHVEHEHSISNTSILKIAVMLLVVTAIIGGGFFTLQSFTGKTEVKLLDVKSEAIALSLEQGEPLKFRLTMLNQGDPGRVDVYLTYTVETQSGNRVIQEQETKAFETTMRDIVTLELPPDLPSGTYTAKTEVNYEDQYALSSFQFYVVKEGEEPPELPPEVPNPTSNPTPEENTEEPELVSPPRDPPKVELITSTELTDDELFTKAIVETDYEIAGGYCQQIQEQALSDECFVYLSSTSQDVSYCDLVTSTSRKEDCKIGFILNGEANLCLEMTLDENKQLCKQFTQLQAASSYEQTGDVDALLGDLHLQPLPPEVPDPTPAETIEDLDIGDVVFPAE